VLWEGGSAHELAQQIVESFREVRFAPAEEQPDELRGVTVSAGVASGADATAVLRAAEDALERAKVLGRNRAETAPMVEP
jgi:PleD family two-component response regulator